MKIFELYEAKRKQQPIFAFSRMVSLTGEWIEFAYITEIHTIGKEVFVSVMDKTLNSVARFNSKDIKLKEG
jgi:hypothetical protein